jgi:hypothetical protein
MNVEPVPERLATRSHSFEVERSSTMSSVWGRPWASKISMAVRTRSGSAPRWVTSRKWSSNRVDPVFTVSSASDMLRLASPASSAAMTMRPEESREAVADSYWALMNVSRSSRVVPLPAAP